MTNPNIEIPEEVKVAAQRIVAGRECYIATTVAMAEFVLGLNKPETKAEPFVLYRVGVRGEDSTYRIGFRVENGATYSWVTLVLSSDDKEDAYPVSMYSVGVHRDEEIEVLERWTPEPTKPEFGIGDADEDVDSGREVLVKGVLGSEYVDGDGDVRVQLAYSDGLTSTHYVAAKDVAYAGENNGN